MNIVAALNDPKVFGRYFKAESWTAWRVFLAALFGLPLTYDQHQLFQQFIGRATAPTSPLNEAWLVVGRRGGKSFVLAVIAVFLACFRDWRPFLGPGEVGTIMIIAKDRAQARSIKRYISGLLRETPMLASVLEEETAESIRLRNRVSIEIHTASSPRCSTRWRSGSRMNPRPNRTAKCWRHPARHGHHSRRHAAVRVIPTCPPWRAVGGVPEALWPGRRSGSGVAGRHTRDESGRAPVLHRRAHGGRSCACAGRIFR
jgi:hypothetical protein